jgi:hypothetical protein
MQLSRSMQLDLALHLGKTVGVMQMRTSDKVDRLHVIRAGLHTWQNTEKFSTVFARPLKR